MTVIIPPEPGPVRPRIVTVAGVLLFLVAACELLATIIGFAVLRDVGAVYREIDNARVGGPTDSIPQLQTTARAVGLVLKLAIGAGFAVLGYFDLAGKQAARIVTWVFGGLYCCCVSLSAAGEVAASSMDFGAQSNTEEVSKILADHLPEGYTSLALVVSITAVLSMLFALILLALPDANAFFRPRMVDPAFPLLPSSGFGAPTPAGPVPPQAGQTPPDPIQPPTLPAPSNDDQ